MRIEATSARTWLAAAVAGWALLFWGLTLAGLGERLGQREDAAEAARPEAAIPAAPAQPPLERYREVSARPLFSADRRPHPFFIDPGAEGEDTSNEFDYVLTSVLQTPGFAMAIVQPAGGGDPIRLRPGDAPPEASAWVLESVAARSVVFTGPEGPRTLELRVYDGVGGQPPTPMRTPQAVADGPSPARRGGPVQAVPDPRGNPGNGAGTANTAAPQPPAGGARRGGNVPPPAADGAGEAATDAGPSEAQVEAIRRRIEERRARLQQQQAGGGPTQ